MPFDISSVGYNWEKLAQDDPLWSILTVDEKKGRRWAIEDFLKTGQVDVDAIAVRCRELGIALPRRRALDFGCGVGRLSAALLKHVDEVVGVDISPTMIDIGRRLHEGKPIEFILNKRSNLDCLADQDFDLILTLITLQHMPPEFQRGYLEAFMRKLEPGGALIFQLPGRSLTPDSLLSARRGIRRFVAGLLPGHVLERFRYLRDSTARMDMFGMPPEEVTGLLEQHGGEVVSFDPLDDIQDGFPNFKYFVQKT